MVDPDNLDAGARKAANRGSARRRSAAKARIAFASLSSRYAVGQALGERTSICSGAPTPAIAFTSACSSDAPADTLLLRRNPFERASVSARNDGPFSATLRSSWKPEEGVCGVLARLAIAEGLGAIDEVVDNRPPVRQDHHRGFATKRSSWSFTASGRSLAGGSLSTAEASFNDSSRSSS